MSKSRPAGSLHCKEGEHELTSGTEKWRPHEVLTHRLTCFSNIAGTVADYSAEARFFTPGSLLRGSEAIRRIITEDHFDKLFNINVRGTLFTVQKALPLLNDGGSIILTGSVAGSKGTPAFGVYGATKAAVRNFVRAWTVELKDRRIRSNVLSPGPTGTPAVDRQPADAIARIVSTIPMGRMGKAEEVAKAALFLASDDSSFVTGIELFVDGGRAQI
jgi:NAD(P)-dependent dehydrogenase (short-subunit alcohol dehydrogenase family)